MKGVKKFLWFLYKCFVFYTLLVCILIFWNPFSGWLAGFMMMSFPVTMIIHLASVPIWFLVERKKALLPLAMLLLGCIFLPRTYVLNKDKTVDKSLENKASFKVMSYNVRSFMRNFSPRDRWVKRQIREVKGWIRDSGADVVCLAEYYEDDSKLFNVSETLKSGGYKYHRFYGRNYGHNLQQRSGLALFSQHPIIASRDTVFEAQNGMIQADIKMGNDTIRIIALHLYSMTLQLSNLVHQREMDGMARESKITFRQMRKGFVRRAGELAVLESWIRESPYPTVVCGDFNEVPYGYVYGRMREIMGNSFEEKGQGFGFTYNHLPYFIRIDHQFYSKETLRATDFTTYSNIKYSDHYPISGVYSIRKLEDTKEEN